MRTIDAGGPASDKGILDWMEGRHVIVSSWPLSGGGRNYHVMTGESYYEAATLREALAAAMIAEKRRREQETE